MSQFPPNNGQPPNWQGQPWQGNQSQYPPQQPWGLPPDQPGQWGPQQPQPSSWQSAHYNQPTQAWQPVPPPPLQRTGKPSKKPLTKRNKIIGVGCFAITLLFLCGVIGVIAIAANAHNGMTATSPTPNQGSILVATSTVTKFTNTSTVAAPTDTPVPTPTATPTATATPKPTPTPTQPIVRQPTPSTTPHCVAVNNNPWCYNFITPGNMITNPPSAFCSYFNCVSTFWVDTNGYVAECGNGKYTHSDGVSGACSRDSGVANVLYSH